MPSEFGFIILYFLKEPKKQMGQMMRLIIAGEEMDLGEYIWELVSYNWGVHERGQSVQYATDW